jgi:hypothetical protein
MKKDSSRLSVVKQPLSFFFITVNRLERIVSLTMTVNIYSWILDSKTLSKHKSGLFIEGLFVFLSSETKGSTCSRLLMSGGAIGSG